MARRKAPSPLRTGFIIARPAIDAAGGVSGMIAVFGPRLLTHWHDLGIGAEVLYPWSTYALVRTAEGIDTTVWIETPRDLQPPVNALGWIETSDVHRGIHPDQVEPDLEEGDRLVASHRALAAAVSAWPEVRPRMCDVPAYARRLAARSM